MVSSESCPLWAADAIITFDLAFDLYRKTQGKGGSTGYRPEFTSARIPKRFQTIASLPVQIKQPLPLTWYLTFKVKFNVKGRHLTFEIKFQVN